MYLTYSWRWIYSALICTYAISSLLLFPVTVNAEPRVVVVADPVFRSTAERIRDKLISEGVVLPDDVVALRVSDPFLFDSEQAQQLKWLNPQVVIAPQVGMFRMMSKLGLKSKGVFFSHGPWASGGDDARLEDIPMMGIRVTSFIDGDAACLDWLASIVPSIRRVGIVASVGSNKSHMARIENSFKSRKPAVVGFFLNNAREAIALLDRSQALKIDAWYFPHTPVVWRGPQPVIDAGKRLKLPLVFEYSHYYAEAGGLMACASQYDAIQRVADAVRYLLADSAQSRPIDFRPASMSVSINMDTAKILGINVPPHLLRRLDHRFTTPLTKDAESAPLTGATKSK